MGRLLLVLAALSVVLAAAPAHAGAPARVADDGCGLRYLVGQDTDATPVGNAPCPGVRPGAQVRMPSVGATCSLNFVFDAYVSVAGERQLADRYVGTAGHCLGIYPQDEGEFVWPDDSGPEAQDASRNRIGSFAYKNFQGVRDFALIRIDDGVEVSPQMCYWGGPTGINDDIVPDPPYPSPVEPTTLRHFGYGVGVSAAVPARTAVAPRLHDPDRAFAYGVAVFGDSGSGVSSADGRALGVLVTAGAHDLGTTIGMTRMAPQVARAEEVLGVSLELVTAPLIDHTERSRWREDVGLLRYRRTPSAVGVGPAVG